MMWFSMGCKKVESGIEKVLWQVKQTENIMCYTELSYSKQTQKEDISEQTL